MLRKLIKSIIPNKGDIFFTLFEDAAINAYESAKLFQEILSSQNEEHSKQLFAQSRSNKQKAGEINQQVLKALNNMFITPIDRGDIQELSGLLFKLNKRIIKISTKLKIYNIEAKSDDCLIENANTLLLICKVLVDVLNGLKIANSEKINLCCEKINELEENSIENLRFAINEIFSGKFDTITILKLKEIYKSIDSAIETGVTASEIVMQISLKTM